MKYKSRIAICMILCLLFLAGCNTMKSADQEDITDAESGRQETENLSDNGFVFDRNLEFEDYTEESLFNHMYNGLKVALASGDPEHIEALLSAMPSFYNFDYDILKGLNVSNVELISAKLKTKGYWEVYATVRVINGCSLIPEGEQILYALFYADPQSDNAYDLGICQLTIGSFEEDEVYTPYIGIGKYAEPGFTSLGYETLRYFESDLYNIFDSIDNKHLKTNILYGYLHDLYNYNGSYDMETWDKTPEDFWDFADKFLYLSDHFDRDAYLAEMRSWPEYDNATGVLDVPPTGFYGHTEHIVSIEAPDSSTEIITIIDYMDDYAIVPFNVNRYYFDIHTDESGEQYAALRDVKIMPFLKYVENGRVFE